VFFIVVVIGLFTAVYGVLRYRWLHGDGMPRSASVKEARSNIGTSEHESACPQAGFKKGKSETDQIELLRKALLDGDELTVRQIVKILTNQDREKAWAIIAEINPGWKMVRTFLSAWADCSVETCARWIVANLPKGGDRSFITQYVIGRWVEKNVFEAAAWVQTLLPEQGRDSALNALFEAWAKLDPEPAARELLLVKNFDTRNLAKGMIAYYWARKDIQAVTDWAWNLPKDSGYNYALSNIARAIYETDKTHGSDWIRSLPVGYTNNPTLRRIAAFLTGEDSAKAVSDLAVSIPGGFETSPDLQMFVVRWTKKKPEEIVAWVGQLPDSRSKEQALYTIAQVLAQVNPAIAAKIAETIPAGASRNSVISKVAAQWASVDVNQATAWAKQLPQDGTAQSAQDAIASVKVPDAPVSAQTTYNTQRETMTVPEILNQDLSVAIGLAEQIPDGSERNAVMHSLALRWAEEDPAGAATWVMQEMPEGFELNATLRTIIWGWAEKDSAGALAWGNQLTDPAKQLDAKATVAMALARINPTDAAGIAAQMPVGEARNNVVANIAFQWAHVDRNAVTTWAQSLSVEQGKEQALAAIQRALNN